MKISKITIKSLFGIKEWSGDGKNIELVGDNGTGKTFDVKEKPKEKYQAQDIYQSHDQSSHNADESSDGVIDGTFKEVDE